MGQTSDTFHSLWKRHCAHQQHPLQPTQSLSPQADLVSRTLSREPKECLMPLRHRRWTILDQTLLKTLPYPFRHLRSSDGQGHGHAPISPGPRKSSLSYPQSTAMRPRTKCFTNYSSFVTAFFFFYKLTASFLLLLKCVK